MGDKSNALWVKVCTEVCGRTHEHMEQREDTRAQILEARVPHREEQVALVLFSVSASSGFSYGTNGRDLAAVSLYSG